MSLRRWLCRRPRRDDHTREVLDEAERTRADLLRVTGRLDQYVTELRARVSLELQRKIGKDISGGRTQA